MKVCSYCGTWTARYARHTCAGSQHDRKHRRANTRTAWLVWGGGGTAVIVAGLLFGMVGLIGGAILLLVLVMAAAANQ
jgi:hypothetical protein